MLGHEASGIVEAVGSNVRRLSPGDRVATCSSIFCGHCSDYLSGHNHLCPDNPQRAGPEPTAPVRQFCNIGGFAEEMVTHCSAVTKLPESMPLDIAALMGFAVLSGIGSITEGARVLPGSSVVVLGCRGVSLNVIQGARLSGTGQIVAVDLSPAKLAPARRCGATDLLQGGEDAVESVQEITLITREIHVIGSLMGSVPFLRVIPTYAQLYLNGRLTLDPLVSHRIMLEDIDRGYDQLIAGETARSVIVFNH